MNKLSLHRAALLHQNTCSLYVHLLLFDHSTTDTGTRTFTGNKSSLLWLPYLPYVLFFRSTFLLF